jgi:hypothetical protein
MFALTSVILSAGMVSAGPAQFEIVNINAPDVGFNDPTPVAPVGGNTGTTLGQQRLNAFSYAASLWAARLDSTVPIRIRARFIPLGTGVLGSAGPIVVFADFPNAVLPNTWYPGALANKMAGFDLDPENDDIIANFSTNFNFYLGLDNNHGPLNDLVTVLLHEFAHGLGFLQLASLSSGALFDGLPDVYNIHLLDNSTGEAWRDMTDGERVASATRFGRVVWTGENVTSNVPTVLSLGSPRVEVVQPSNIAGQLQFGLAAFGPTIASSPAVNENVVAAVDAVEPPPPGGAAGTTTDGCSPFSNAAAVAGKIVLIERGFCGFAVKARNATDAGADAVVIYNNAANATAAPPGMADDGINGPFVTIPAISIRRSDGLTILGAAGVSMDITVDVAIRAGADALNRARMYAPSPVSGGSSISHYDTVASRNLLMEPAISADLTHNLESPNDLTRELLRDIGWFDDDDGDLIDDAADCDTSSDLRLTIVVGSIDTGVPNFLFTTGCTGTDLIEAIAASAGNHGGFVSGVAHLTNAWKQAGIITGQQKGAIQSAAAQSN